MARHERRTPTRSWCLSFGRQFRSRASSPSLRASGCVSSTSTGRSAHAIVCLLHQPCHEAHRRTTADQSLSVTPYDSLSCPRCSEHNRGHVTLHSFFVVYAVYRYWRNPSRTPMFKDLVSKSKCGSGRSGSLNQLYDDLIKSGVKPVMPTGAGQTLACVRCACAWQHNFTRPPRGSFDHVIMCDFHVTSQVCDRMPCAPRVLKPLRRPARVLMNRNGCAVVVRCLLDRSICVP